MVLFFSSFIALVLGYVFYGAFVARVFGASDTKKTPALIYADGVDFVPLSPVKIFLIQFLNIAGLGPVCLLAVDCVWKHFCRGDSRLYFRYDFFAFQRKINDFFC